MNTVEVKEKNGEMYYKGTKHRRVVKQFGKPVASEKIDKQRNRLYQKKFYLRDGIRVIESGVVSPRKNSKTIEGLKRQLTMVVLQLGQLSGKKKVNKNG